MVGSLIASALLTLAASMEPSWPALLLMRTLAGLTLGGVPAVAMAYLSEKMHAKAIGLAMGLYMSGNALSGMSGRLVTGAVTDLSSWRVAIAAIGVLALLAAVAFCRSLPPSSNCYRPPVLARSRTGWSSRSLSSDRHNLRPIN
jgi:MFS transporter, YNFM family, putative membrane transport protein